ncbi:MAG: tetratricopeptide repeat protein [Rhodospirillales bacterium]|nr:tetratricopeptide repeat protein [Rhodospirillales bacterium]
MTVNLQEMLQRGRSLHHEGRLGEAESFYRRVLSHKPSHPEANYLLGVLCFQAGDSDSAVKLISKAVRKRPREADYHLNLGAALGTLGRLDEALKCFRAALRLSPGSVQAQYNIGGALQQQGLLAQSLEAYNKAIAIDPAHAGCHNNAGTALMALGRPEEAVASYQKALEAVPTFADAHFNLGVALGRLGRHDEALESYRQAVALRPDYVKAFNNMGLALREQGLPEDALAAFDKALAIDPAYGEAHCNKGAALDDLGRLDEALEAFNKAIELDPDFAESHHNLGNTFQKMRRMEEARTAYREAIRIDSAYGEAHRRLAQSWTHTGHDDEIRAMETLFDSPDCPDEQKMHLGFGLGKAFEDLGQYQKAFAILHQANSLIRKTYRYDIADEGAFLERICSVFSAPFLEDISDTGLADETPIFILGMPRSGTTLVEQILASHPQVHGAGELNYMAEIRNKMTAERNKPFPEGILEFQADDFRTVGLKYMERLRKHSQKTKHITDKMPHNFLNIGLIRAALPQATIIHCKRNPMDTCLSIYKNYFSGVQPYAYDLEELGQHYRQYLKIMDHWRGVFPNSIVEVQYEDLVAHAEDGIRSLLKACGLSFEPACLQFYKSDRIVETVSVNQVRRPMYKSSIDSWKRYESDLEPLLKAINPD